MDAVNPFLVGPFIDRIVLLLPPLVAACGVHATVGVDPAVLAKAKKAEEGQLIAGLEADANEGESLLFPGFSVSVAKAGSSARKGYRAAFHVRSGEGGKGDPTLTLQVAPVGAKAAGFSCRADWNPARFTKAENERLFEGLVHCASPENIAPSDLLPHIRVTRVDAAFDLPGQGFGTYAFVHRTKHTIRSDARRVAGLCGVRFGAEGDSHVLIYDRSKLPENPSDALRLEFRIFPNSADQPLLALPHLGSPLKNLMVLDVSHLSLSQCEKRLLAISINTTGLRSGLDAVSMTGLLSDKDLLQASVPSWWSPDKLWARWPKVAQSLLAVAIGAFPPPPLLTKAGVY
jgi:hypothetical protein